MMQKNNSQNKSLSNFISNIPKTPDLMTRNKYPNSAVMVLFVQKGEELFIVFEKRAENISQGGDICFPGGSFDKDKDKTFLDTAFRETYEEIGLKKKDIKFLGQMDTFFAPIGKVLEVFVGLIDYIDYEKNLNIQTSEVAKVFLFNVDELKSKGATSYKLRIEICPSITDKDGNTKELFPIKKLNLPKHYEKPWGHNKHEVLVYEIEDEIIWGLSSIVLADILDKY